MNKSFNVSLNGIVFNIEEDAYDKLSGYLDSIKNHYNAEDGKEILADIESNLAEKFSACLSSGKQVIVLEDVTAAIKIMGTVDEFAGEKKPAEDKAVELSEDKEGKLSRRLYRNPDDMVIAGVCSGLAAYFGIDPVYVRILFVVLIFLNGFGLLAYLILWLVMPVAETNVQKLEMRGRPVNLKKLEQVVKEKATQMTQEGKNAYKKNQKWITRILSFPIDVIRQVILFLKKTLSKILPIIGILIGIGFSLAAAAGVLGLSLAVGIMMFNIGSPYIASDLPVQEIASSVYYYIGLTGLYFCILIPAIFLLFIGISLIRRKNIFRLSTVIFLIALWIVSTVCLSVSALNIAPMAKDKFDQNIAKNTVTENLKFDNVKKIRVGGSAGVKVVPGNEFNLKITGSREATDEFKYENKDGELQITQSQKNDKFCLLCSERKTQIEITLPELESFIAFGSVNAEVADFGKDIQVNVGEAANVRVFSSSTTLTSYIAGTGGSLEVAGSPKVLKATLEGNGRLTAEKLAAEMVEINATIMSDVYLGGTAQNVKIKTSNYSHVYAFDLAAFEVMAESDKYSTIEINSSFSLDAKAEDNAEIIYLREPKNLKRQEFGDGQVVLSPDTYEERGDLYASSSER